MNASDPMREVSLLLGRLFLAALFIPAGIEKAMTSKAFTEGMAAKGLPFPEVVTALAIAVELFAGAALVAGVWPRISAWLLILFTAAATWVSHRYWLFDGAAREMHFGQFYKNLAIAGGLLFYSVVGAGALRIGRRSQSPAPR